MDDEILSHYERTWGPAAERVRPVEGPMKHLLPEFEVLVFRPGEQHRMWTYATHGMSLRWAPGATYGIETHLFSPSEYAPHIELLTALAYFHLTSAPLDLGGTVNFGRAWMEGSSCTHGLLARPYTGAEGLEWAPSGEVRCLWLVPITVAERDYGRRHGVEALERAFEESGAFNYLDPGRPNLV